jgi:hypothetical protein
MQFPRPELLLHPLVPPPLHGLAPRTILGVKWWDEQRHQAMAKNFYKCWACNIPRTKARKYKWLEGHESYNIDWERGTATLVEIVSLCHFCHNYIHRGRLEMLLRYGKLNPDLYAAIIKHGDNITAGLKRPPSPKRIAPWAEWVLVINGKPYPSRFRSEDEWRLYYHWLNTTDMADTDINFQKFKKISYGDGG